MADFAKKTIPGYTPSRLTWVSADEKTRCFAYLSQRSRGENILSSEEHQLIPLSLLKVLVQPGLKTGSLISIGYIDFDPFLRKRKLPAL
jgi:hypothetical protein